MLYLELINFGLAKKSKKIPSNSYMDKSRFPVWNRFGAQHTR